MEDKRNHADAGEPDQQYRNVLRLRSGILIVILLWLIRFGIPFAWPEYAAVGVLGGSAGALVFFIWWAFFSRAPGFDRWLGLALMIGVLYATSYVVHESIATGMRGMMFYTYALPVLSLVFVIWAVASRKFSPLLRRVSMVSSILIGCGLITLVRSDGINVSSSADFAWRWAETAEERLLAQYGDEPMEHPTTLLANSPTSDGNTEVAETSGLPGMEASWPGFRGPERDGTIHGVKIETDWSVSPPKELWRQPVGPGCSSFAVFEDLIYTQEQRGEYEGVTCYDKNTGKLIWRHLDKARFWDSHAGAGPRGTPTISDHRVYTLGATGIVNVLNASDGTVVWSNNAAEDTGIKLPGWGFASSPLVVGDVVIVAIGGQLIAYDLASGDHRWSGPDGGGGYSSPHLMTIDGIPQVVLMSDAGASSFEPSDGALLWDYPSPHPGRILQPAMTSNGDILLVTGGAEGITRVTVKQGPGGWTIDKQWNSTHLKSYFNDVVVHEDHAYGFTGSSLACIDLTDGQREWKGGRYGGQIILLADQDLLLVLTEKGELALVEANAERLKERARWPAIKGKTWNHPVLAGNILLVRNAIEMVAFQLSLADKNFPIIPGF